MTSSTASVSKKKSTPKALFWQLALVLVGGYPLDKERLLNSKVTHMVHLRNLVDFYGKMSVNISYMDPMGYEGVVQMIFLFILE